MNWTACQQHLSCHYPDNAAMAWFMTRAFPYAGAGKATQPDGTPAPKAQLAYHHAEGTPALLAMALGQTIYIAVMPNDLDRGAVLDCTSETGLPLSSMTSIQASHQIRCLAFSPSGDKLAAVNSAEQVMLQGCRACRLKYTACHEYACMHACAICEASCNCLLGTFQPNVQGCADIYV